MQGLCCFFNVTLRHLGLVVVLVNLSTLSHVSSPGECRSGCIVPGLILGLFHFIIQDMVFFVITL